MKYIKLGVLAFLLFFPASIYLFLRGFGENKFEIPIYYEAGIDTLTSCGRLIVSNEYKLASNPILDSLLDQKATLYDFGVLTNSTFRSERNNMMSFLNKHQSNDIQLASLYLSDTIKTVGGYDNIVYIQMEFEILKEFSSCQVFRDLTFDPSGVISHSEDLVLVDSEQRIRGYYNPSDLEEIDRLKIEVDILLKEENGK